MAARIGMISVGNELLSGSTADSNATFIARWLTDAGYDVVRKVTVGDDISEITFAIEALAERVDGIVMTGGLGPTSDDLTRDAVAATAGTTLELNSDSLTKLERYAKKRNRVLRENNKRQAYFPASASIIPNEWGTADAFLTPLDQFNVAVLCLPGVPREMIGLLEGPAGELLRQRVVPAARGALQTLSVFGLSESYIGATVDELTLPQSVTVAYRPTMPVVKLYLSATGSSSEEDVAAATERIIAALGEQFVFSRDATQSMAQVVGAELGARGIAFAAVESCTGGRVSDHIVSVPGASSFFRAGVVSYANEAKEAFAGVHNALIERHGAVSSEVAAAMATGVLHRIGADMVVSTTGIAGPDGGSDEKPVGTVWIGLATRQTVETVCCYYPIEREAFRDVVAHRALDMVRRKMLGLPLDWKQQ